MGRNRRPTSDETRAMRFRIALAVFGFGAAIASVAALNWGEEGTRTHDLSVVALIVGCGIAILGTAGLFAFSRDDAERTRTSPGSYRDRIQRDWVSRITVLPAAAFGLTVIAMSQAGDWLSGEDRDARTVILAGVAVLNLLIIPAMVMGWDGGSRKVRRLLDDELTRAYRASAMTWACWVLLVGVAGVYLVGLWKADAAVIALPMILWLGAATVALRFAQLHRRAEREMGDDG